MITGLSQEVTLPEQDGKRPSGASEAFREIIELELSRGRNAMGIRIWSMGTGLQAAIKAFRDSYASCAERYRLKRG